MNRITAIIVDDERRSRELLINLLDNFDNINVFATAESVDHALELIRLNQPDLVFLDIEMPNKNGFELIELLIQNKLNPVVIFTTAYDKYAIKAFKYAAFDYLLKPIKLDVLRLTIDRLFKNNSEFNLTQNSNKLNQFFQEKNLLKLDLRTGTLIIEPKELVLCNADGNYTHLYLADGKQETVTFNIGEILKMLPDQNFYRTDRSHIINLLYLKKIDSKGKSIELKLNDRYKKIKLSKENITRLREKMQVY